MAGSGGYIYTVRMPLTAVTIAKTLVQIKSVGVPLDLVSIRVYQTTKISSELQGIQIVRYSGAYTAGTVTSATPVRANRLDTAAAAVGGTAATGVNATVEPSGGTADTLDEDVWNILNASWEMLDIPEGRYRAAAGDLMTIKLNTAPAASQTTGCVVRFQEMQ